MLDLTTRADIARGTDPYFYINSDADIFRNDKAPRPCLNSDAQPRRFLVSLHDAQARLCLARRSMCKVLGVIALVEIGDVLAGLSPNQATQVLYKCIWYM
jgi:hypothetical protein